MARQETIEVKLAKSQTEYSSILQEMKNDAKDLKKAFGDIKIGNNAKALKEQAAAEKEAAKAATEKAKAEKEAANAEKARYQTVKELENATKAKLQAEKEAQNVVTAQIKTQKEAANAEKAREQAERAHIQTQKAQLSLTKQLTTSHHALADSLKSLVLQYVSLQTATRSLRYALTEMKNMSDEMIVYQKVTKASAEEMEKIRAASYDTAKRYGQTPTDFLSAAQEMARAGYKDQSAAMADLAIKTKLVGDITAEEASKFLLAVDAGYKYSGSIEKLSEVLDQANEIGNNYATSVGKLSEGMTLVASLGAQANIPIEQLMAALGTMTAATQRSGSEMARALRFTILGVLGDTTSEVEEGVTVTKEEVESLSTALEYYAKDVVDAAKASGKLINPMEALGALAKAYKEGLIGSEEELFKISKQIAGQRYYNAFAALISNWDTMYQGMLEKEQQALGSADAEIAVLTNSWTTKLNVLKTTWTEMVNKSISEGFIKDLITGSTEALKFAGSLENLALMAGGAYEAIKSLSYGIKNLRLGKNFGTANLALGLAGVGVAVLGYVKSAYEQSQRELVQSAVKAGEEATEALEKSTKIETILEKYKSIVSDGIQPEKGELEKLKTLQDDLNKLIGDQAKAIDIVNGKYDDTLKKLKNITEEQRAAALMTANAKLTETIAALKGADWNGTAYFGKNQYGRESTGTLTVDEALYKYLKGYFKESGYKYFAMDDTDMGWELRFIKPETLETVKEFNEELNKLYEFMGTEKIGDSTFGEKYSSFFNSFNKFRETARQSIDPVYEANKAVEALSDSTKKLAEASEESNKETEEASSATEKEKESVDDLTNSINNAITAKKKFDEAMKSTKADAMNDYISAFKTLKGEIDEGRVNSTAYYAAARMLLGDKAYAATGGTSQGVMKALKNKGASGSVMEAYDILSGTYKDSKTGKIMEGAGIYQLLSQTKGFEGKLVDKNGNMYIPNLSESDLNKISKQWGGLSKEFILSALDAFDQYDKKGSATDENVQAKIEEDRKKETDHAMELSVEAQNNNTTALDENTKAIGELSEQIQTNNENVENDGIGAGDESDEKPDISGLGAGVLSGATSAAGNKQGALQPRGVNGSDEIGNLVPDLVDGAVGIVNDVADRALGKPSEDNIGEFGVGSGIGSIGISLGNLVEGAVNAVNETADSIFGTSEEATQDAQEAMGLVKGNVEALLGIVPDVKESLQDLEEEISMAELDAAHGKTQGQSNATDLSGHWQAEADSVRAIQEAVNQANKSVEEARQSLQDLEEEQEISMAELDAAHGKTQQYTSDLKDHWESEEESVKTAKEATHAVDQILQETTQTLKALEDEEEEVSMAALEAANNTQENAEEHKKLFSEYENSLQQMLALKQELEATDGDMYEAQKNLGTSWGEVKEAFLDYQKYVIDNPVKPDLDNSQIRDAFEEFMRNWSNLDITWGLNANPNSAIMTAEATRNAINNMTASIKITGKYVGTAAPMLAGGTRSHAGGPAIVNDGSGPELVVDNGNAFIANGGKPAIVTLNKGAKVFTASETRGILGGSGIPAYANGVGDITAGKFNGLVRVTDDDDTKSNNNSSGKSGSKSGSGKKAATFDSLKDIINYIINRIGTALDQQIEIIDKQIEELKAQRESKQQQDELLEKQKNLTTAMNERTVRYIDSKGKWHWEADRNKVAQAQEELQKYKEELEFNAKVQALENQKTALQDEYKQITTAWQEIQDAAATPTGNLTSLINQVISTGSKTDKKAAETVQSLLISSLLSGGSYKKNYKEALTAISKATAGNPIMPGESKNTLASLIAMGGSVSGDITSSLMKTSGALSSGGNVSLGTAGAGSQVNYNYFIDGMKIGSDQANQSLSSIMRQLSVYANTGVA